MSELVELREVDEVDVIFGHTQSFLCSGPESSFTQLSNGNGD